MSDSDLPGTGVDPTKNINPTKRLKAAWRKSGTKLSLKAWAGDASKPYDEYALQWADNKSPSRTAQARKDRKSRVRTAQIASRSNRPASSGKKGKGKGKGK